VCLCTCRSCVARVWCPARAQRVTSTLSAAAPVLPGPSNRRDMALHTDKAYTCIQSTEREEVSTKHTHKADTKHTHKSTHKADTKHTHKTHTKHTHSHIDIDKAQSTDRGGVSTSRGKWGGGVCVRIVRGVCVPTSWICPALTHASTAAV
jgi:hypothetical protein